MKATGIVRRIDDLGRVVVPKEIRRTLGIREGTPLEIFTGKDGEVILKKYSPLGEIYTFEPFPGIGSADVYHRHGKGDRCIRGREKGCSGPGDFRGVRGTSGGTPDGTKRGERKGDGSFAEI